MNQDIQKISLLQLVPHDLSQTDDELVDSIAGGDESAFAELISRHKSMVFHVVRRYFKRQDEVVTAVK